MHGIWSWREISQGVPNDAGCRRGAVAALFAQAEEPDRCRRLQLISVVLAVLIGSLFLRDPAQAMLTITVLLIVFFMIEGISKVVFALTIRPFPQWGWVLASGLLGILLSLFLWARIPETALWLIGLLVGIELIGEGAALVNLAWRVRET